MVHHFNDAGDPPEGMSKRDFDLWYNRADSQIYNQSKKDKKKSKAARQSGRTRRLALALIERARAAGASESAAAPSFQSASGSATNNEAAANMSSGSASGSATNNEAAANLSSSSASGSATNNGANISSGSGSVSGSASASASAVTMSSGSGAGSAASASANNNEAAVTMEEDFAPMHNWADVLKGNPSNPANEGYQKRYNAAKTDKERYKIIQECECTPRIDDSKLMLEMREKWNALFEAGTNIVEIKRIQDQDWETIRKRDAKARASLQDLTLAEAAHKKGKKAKKEKKEKKLQAEAKRVQAQEDYRYLMLSIHTKPCAGKDCHNMCVPDPATGTMLFCRICFRLDENYPAGRKEKAYCTLECQNKNELKHIIEAHPCAAGENCLKLGNGVARQVTDKIHLCESCFRDFKTESVFCCFACHKAMDEQHHIDVHQRLLMEMTADFSAEETKEVIVQWMMKNGFTRAEALVEYDDSGERAMVEAVEKAAIAEASEN